MNISTPDIAPKVNAELCSHHIASFLRNAAIEHIWPRRNARNIKSVSSAFSSCAL